MRRIWVSAAFAALVVAGGGTAWAQAKGYGGAEGLAAFLRLLTDQIEVTFSRLPEVGRFVADLARRSDARTVALLGGVIAAGLVAEWLARQLLVRVRHRIHGHGSKSPLRSLLQVMLLDGLALVALWVAARAMVGQLGDPQSTASRVGHQLVVALVYWRAFNFIFRAWLRPASPGGRLAPVDDLQALRLLHALNVVIVLPLIARTILLLMPVLGASTGVAATAAVLYIPFVAAGLVWAVWHWRRDMAAWLEGMVSPKDLFRPAKVAAARNWWVAGLIFYVLSGLLAIYAALTEQGLANRGLTAIESLLILLLLFETLIFRLTRHLPTELPTIGDVVAGCVRLAVRLWVVVAVCSAITVGALGAMAAEEWAPHDRAAKLAALSALAFYVGWRLLKFRMDRYIADNPLPSAGFGGDAEDDDQPSAASRLRTIMPVLRVTAGVTILIVGSLLVLSELGVNITPLIAGASVLGLAVSFGSQSLVRDIVSGIFFLAEDSFRVGEYIDASKVKGTVEGFSVRSIRLRHQNGQLHIVPFGQLLHVTNFSRDWTTVKFNLAFAINSDVELLRKTVKKIGIDMMNEPQWQKELLQPLKMQGIVDIKDASLIVRFKFTARPKNPSMIQRLAIRRMFDQLPKLGIEFAKPPYAAFGFGGVDPAARAAAQ